MNKVQNRTTLFMQTVIKVYQTLTIDNYEDG